MGRIKTLLVKRTARKLIEKFPKKFKDNFEENKKLIANIPDLEIDKKIRNSVAGYITRLVRKQRTK
jgi:small subunit ribosomal protein S17e